MEDRGKYLALNESSIVVTFISSLTRRKVTVIQGGVKKSSVLLCGIICFLSVSTSTPSSSVAVRLLRTRIRSCLFAEPWYAIPSQTGGGWKSLSPDSYGHTLVAYMPSHSWPLHRCTCTNYLIKTCALEVWILTVSHTHACTHCSTDRHVTEQCGMTRRMKSFVWAEVIFSVPDLSMRLIHVTCMGRAAWKLITGITSWQQIRKINVGGFLKLTEVKRG